MPNTHVPAAGEALPAAVAGWALPVLAILLLLAAASLRTRLVRLWLALRLLRTANTLHEAGSRVLDRAQREAGQ